MGQPDEIALSSVVAVCAHPDDESFGLGAVIDSLVRAGTAVSVLSFTHGEASTLHGVAGDLDAVRAAELAAAAATLSVTGVRILEHADGRLDETPIDTLVGEVVAYASQAGADGFLAFDPAGITGHPDHVRATEAALAAGDRLGLPVLAWSIPAEVASALNAEFGAGFSGIGPGEVDVVLEVDRSVQRQAIERHISQCTDNPVLYRRLELLGDVEWLRWLRSPDRARTHSAVS